MPDILGHPAILAALGLVVGFLGALAGVGGGFLLVPYFVKVLGWPHARAVGTSLGIILANAASGSLGYLRQRRVDVSVGLLLAVSTLPGTVAGKYAAERINGRAFGLAFAAVTAIAAALLVVFQNRAPSGLAWFRAGWRRSFTDARGETHEYAINPWFGVAASVAVGAVSSLFGVGGGFLHVPMMVLVYAMPPHVAVATSTFALMVTAAGGAAQYALARPVPYMDVRALLYAGLGAFVGAQLGSWAAPKIAARGLRLILAVILLLAGAWMAVPKSA